MKKIFILMFLILSVGMVWGATITVNSSDMYGSGGSGDTNIVTGENVTLEFNYTLVNSFPFLSGSITIAELYIEVTNGGTEYVTVTEFSPFSGVVSAGTYDGSTSFVMPFLEGINENTTMELLFKLKDGGSNSSSYEWTSSGSSLTNDETLPVELSAFTAVATAEDFVNISWTVQSETNISGYFIIRGLQNNIETALMIPAFINATNSAQEHSYSFTDKEVTPNNIYFYWLQSVEFSLQTELFGPIMVKVGNPTGGETVPSTLGTQLIGNYPNPFNPSTSVSFSVANPSDVSIDIYNVKGQLVKNLYNSFVPANKVNQRIDVLWKGRDNKGQAVASGVYYTKMTAGKHTEFKKMLMMK